MDLSELLEDETKGLVIIYPGRFHPFHIGHGKVYQYLKRKYPNAQVFISTSDKTDGDRSPFTFEEKKKMMMLAGVDSGAIRYSKSPYQSVEITSDFDENKTVVVFAVSEKDMAEEPRFDFSNGISFKKNGEPAYMQKWKGLDSAETFSTHGYIATTPTFGFKVRGEDINSASQIRNLIANSDDTELSQILQDLYNITDIPTDVIEIFKRKIGNKETMNENWSEYSLSEFLIEIEHKEKTMKKGILKSISEGKSPHKKGTKKYNAHMAAIHAESIDEEFGRKVKEITEAKFDIKESLESVAADMKGYVDDHKEHFDAYPMDIEVDDKIYDWDEYWAILDKVYPDAYDNQYANESKKTAECSACNGTGWDSTVTSDEDERDCDECGGTGEIGDLEEMKEADGYHNDQHEMLEYIHHVLQECGDGNVDNAMVDQAIGFVEDIREQHFNADGSTKSESVAEAKYPTSQIQKRLELVDLYLQNIDEYVGVLNKHNDGHAKPEDPSVEQLTTKIQGVVNDIRGKVLNVSINESVEEKDIEAIDLYLQQMDYHLERIFDKNKREEERQEDTYRVQNAVDDIRTRILDLPASNLRSKYIRAPKRSSWTRESIEEKEQLNEWIQIPLWAIATAIRVGGPTLIKLAKFGWRKVIKPGVVNTTSVIIKNPVKAAAAYGVYDVLTDVGEYVKEIKDMVGDAIDEISIQSLAELAWKNKLPLAAVAAVLYGGSKLKSYMKDNPEDGDGDMTINNYYYDSEPATEGSKKIGNESIDNDTLIQIVESNEMGDLIVLDEDGKLVNRAELLENPAVWAILTKAADLGIKFGKPIVQAVAKKVGKYFTKDNAVIGSKIKTSGRPPRLGPQGMSGQGSSRIYNPGAKTQAKNADTITLKPYAKLPVEKKFNKFKNLKDGGIRTTVDKVKVAEDPENIDISLGRRHTTDKVDLTRRPRYSFKGEPLDPSNEWGHDDVEVSNWKDHYSNYDDRIQRLARRKMKEWIKEDVDAEEKVSTLTKMQTVYKHNEDRNNHSENILMLAQAFGDRGEIKAIQGLLKTIRQQGYVTPEQSEIMYNSIHKKYIRELFPINEVWPAIAAAGAAGYGLYKGGKKFGEWLKAKHKQITNSDQYKAYRDFPSNVKKLVTKDYNPIKSLSVEEGYNLEAKSIDIMTKAMKQSIDEDDSWKLWPSGTAGKNAAKMKAQAQDNPGEFPAFDAMRDLWYGPKKPKSVAKGTGKYGPANRYKPAKPLVTGDKTHLRNREIEEGPRDKTHLIKRQKAQAYAKQHARDPELYGDQDSPERVSQQAAYNKKHATHKDFKSVGIDYKSDKHGIYGKAWDVAQQNAVKKANKQNKAADAKLVSTLPFTKSVAKGTGAKGPVGGAKAPVSTVKAPVSTVKAPVSTVAKPGRIKMKIKKSDLFGKGSSKSTKPSDNTIDWNLGYDDEFGSKPVTGREKILKINKKTNTVKAPVSTGRTKMTLKKSDVPDFFFGKKSSKSRDDIFKGADLGHKGNWVESILHYSDAKGTPKYKEGYKAARKGVKYEDNPYKGSEKLQWSKGHNDWRADKLTRDGEPNYGARGQFENKR
jgi:hypothetical protein